MAGKNQIRYSVGFDVQQNGLKQLKSSLQELQKLNINDVIKINNGDVEKARKAFMDIKKEAAAVEDALDQAFNPKLNMVNVETFNQKLIGSKTNLEKVYQTFKSAGAGGEAAFRQLTSSLLNTNIQLKESHELLEKMATTLGNSAKWAISSGIINGMSRSIEQAWGYVKSLDTSLNDIRVVTGKSADEMAKFAVQANNAAKELGKTTTDYTNASLIYAQQGLSDKEVAERAAITLKTANVTRQSTDQVSQQLTAVWNGYKVNAEEAELYVDRLAAVAATTASDLEELSTGMSKVASAAATMGVSEEQLAAQLSTIISATRESPETIGTSLRTVFARISDIKAGLDEEGVTLGNYTGKMKDLGFNVLDANGNLRDMGEIIEEIGGKWNTLTREQQVNLTQTMAGQRQYSRLMALFDNFDKYESALKTAQNAAGTLQEQQDIYMESTAAHLKTLKASMEDVYDSLINQDALEDINKLIDGLSEAGTFMAQFIDSLGGGTNILSSLGAIGVTVFSKQIAGSLQTTINNFTRAKEQAEYFRNAIAQAQEIQSKGLGDDYTQFLAREQESLLKIGGRLSPESFNAIQNTLQKMSENSGAVDVLEEKIQLLSHSFNSAGINLDKFSVEWGTLDELLASADGVEQVKQALNKLKESFDPIVKKQQQARAAYKVFVTDIQRDSPRAAQSFNNLKTSMLDLIKSFKTTTFGDSTDSLFSKLPENARKAILKTKFELQKLDFSQFGNPQQASQKMAELFRTLNETIKREIENTQQLMKSADNGELEKLQEKLKALQETQKQLEQEYDSLKQKGEQTIKTQDLVSLAGGVAQIASGIQQFQNLGSIWKNQDLSTGQKLLQIITNLSFTIPLLTGGFMKAMSAIGLLSVVEKEEAAAAFESVAAHTTHTGSLLGVKFAADKTTISIGLLNKTIQMNPYVLAIAGALAFVAVLGTMAQAAEEANKALIEQNNVQIETQNQKQEEIEKNKELYNSLEELDKKYKDHEITRYELKSAVQDLIDQYGLQGQAADKLRSHYDDLAESIRIAKGQQTRQALQSAERERDAAKSAVVATAQNTGNRFAGGYSLRISGSGVESQQVTDIIDKYLSENSNIKLVPTGIGQASGSQMGYYDFAMGSNIENIIELYDFLQNVQDDLEQNVDKGILGRSDYYNNINNWLITMRDSVEKYKAALEDVKKYSVELAAITAENNGKVHLSTVETSADYLRERSALIKEIEDVLKANGDDVSKAVDMADAYLSENFRNLYLYYNEYAQAIEDFRKQIGTENVAPNVQNLITSLDEQHLGILLGLDLSTVNNWFTLQEIIQGISNIDLSNLSAITNLTQLRQAQLTAAEQYNTYQSVGKQVQKGETISSDTFQSLVPELQRFFIMVTDGTYKMVGDAEDFYDEVNNLKLDGFYDALDGIDTAIERSKNFNDNYSSDDLSYISKTAYSITEDPKDGQQIDFNWNKIGQQLDFLEAVSGTNAELQAQVVIWRQIADAQSASGQAAFDFADRVTNAVKEQAEQLQNLSDQQDVLQAKRAEIYHQIYQGMFPTDEDINMEVLQSLLETIQDIADESEELADSLETDTQAAEDVAEAILRFDDAIQDVVDNYDDWIDILNNGSIQEQSEVINDLKDAYSDLLDLDGGALSNDFLTNAENLDLMKAAIDGDIDAYNQLMELAGQDILAQVGIDTSRFYEDKNNIQTEIYNFTGQQFDDIEIGAALNDEDFLIGLSNMVTAAGMTAQQATDYLASMGVDAEVIQQDTEATETKTQTGWDSELVPVQATGSIPIVQGTGQKMRTSSQPIDYTVYSSKYTPTFETATDTKENKSFALKVTSAHKSSGGNFKFNHSSNGGGSKGTARRSSGGGGKKGGGGGGGGKKGSSASPDTSKKDTKKAAEDERDIYHDINIELDQINRQLERVQKVQDRLYGKDLLNNLNKQTDILEKQKQKLRQKQKIQVQDLATQRDTLKNLGVTFDKYGNISNYMTILANKQDLINAKTKEYNALVESYNASTDKEVKKQISEEIEALNKQIKQMEDDYKDIEKKIKDYDSLREDMEDLVDQVEEITQKEIELNIKKFRMEIELRLEMGQAERDWNKFRREVLEHTDVIKDTNFQGIFNDATQNVRDAVSYFNIHGSRGSLETLIDQLNQTRQQIEAIDSIGNSAIYGDNKAQAMEDLKGDLSELMNQMEDMESLIDDIDNAYLDTIDDVADQFDKQIEDYEYVRDLLEHDMNLLTLLYGDRNYAAMDKYYAELAKNNNEQLDSLKQQSAFWQERWSGAVAAGDLQAAKEFEQHYRDTINNLNQLIEDAAKNLQDKYINAIDNIFNALDKKISNGKGTDYLNTEWDLMNKNADEYLDTINAAFAVQETERKYQKALNDTQSIKNQRALKNLMDQQLDILRNKEKITQYDIDRAEKLLQVEQARIALEDAQSAKTSMRLKRDSQGNYSYEYVADNGAIEDAQANLATAQNDLYNFDKDRYKSNLDDMLAAWKDFQSEYKDIVVDTSLTEEERVEKLALLREEYGEYINDKTAENLVIRNNLMESAFADLALLYETDVANYNQMSIDEQNILMGDLVPAWESGIQQMADKVAGENGFIPLCKQAFDNITEATKDYEDELDNMVAIADVDLNHVQEGIDELSLSMESLIAENDDLIDQMGEEMDAIKKIRVEVQNLAEDYKSVYDAAQLAVFGIHSFIQAQQKQAAEAAKKENEGTGSSGTTTPAPQPSETPSVTPSPSEGGSSGPSLGEPSEELIEGIAGNIWVYNTWGAGAARRNNIISKFGQDQGQKIFNAVQAKFNSGYGYNGLLHNWDYYKKFNMSSFDTGGYTGNWIGNTGRLAVLHKKEIVLNQDDTKNLLNSVNIIRSVMSTLNGNMTARLSDIKSGVINNIAGNNGIEQVVHIDATFPNVDSKREIEEAFNDLVNLAAQRAMRR